MKIETLNIEKLIPYARNARTHSDTQVAQIAASIREFGFCNPVLIDNEDGIVAGHGRVLAARRLGIKEIPCVRLGWITETQRRAYIIADNKLALKSGWDEEMLKVELDALRTDGFSLELTGFEEAELGKLLSGGGRGGSDSESGSDFDYEEKFSVVVECADAHEQEQVYSRLVAEGLSCRVLVN